MAKINVHVSMVEVVGLTNLQLGLVLALEELFMVQDMSEKS